MGALPLRDGYGYPALSCALDGGSLEPLPGSVIESEPVLRCVTCGHRTDEPGDGVLGDAFDIIHRQWGLRGDVHAWRSLRDLLATTPTPATAEAVREVFVEGLRQVADLDIDATADDKVYRAHLDHGGMSGGVVDADWWGEKGVPLLVLRATGRRPPVVSTSGTSPAATEPGRGAGGTVVTVIIWVLILGIPAALVGGGGWLLYQRAVGTPVEATVLDCDSTGNFRRYGSTFRTECVAEWTVDGRTVVGGFNGGNGESDVGKTVDATVRGDTAYSRSLGLPLLLIALGLPFLALPVIAIRHRLRNRDHGARAASTSLPA